MTIARHLARPTRESYRIEQIRAGKTGCSLFGLASDGVYLASKVTFTAGELLPHRFTLTWLCQAVYFLLHLP